VPIAATIPGFVGHDRRAARREWHVSQYRYAQYPWFEQMVISIRQRLRPTDAYLLADRLRICVGLNYSKADETRLLKMLLEEVSLT
jgi:hypothetical protein